MAAATQMTAAERQRLIEVIDSAPEPAGGQWTVDECLDHARWFFDKGCIELARLWKEEAERTSDNPPALTLLQGGRAD